MSNDLELKDVFSSAARAVEALRGGTLRPLSHEYIKLYSECLRLLALSTQKADQLDLFSANEELEDITTSTLKYLNIDFYAAKVLEATPVDTKVVGVRGRIAAIKASVRKYLDYLTTLDSIKLLRNEKSLLYQVLPSGSGGAFNLEMLAKPRSRETVVSDFRKLQKEQYEFQSEVEKAGRDEEASRSFETRRLKYHAIVAWDSVRSSTQELLLLGHALSQATREGEPEAEEGLLLEHAVPSVPGVPYGVLKVLLGRRRMVPSDVSDGDSGEMSLGDVREKLDSFTRVEPAGDKSNGLLNRKGQPLQPFRIVQSRDNVARQVFGTGQQMPTMTVEELLQKEMADGRIVQPSSDDISKAEVVQTVEDEYRKDDEATMKARAWDDFTEANPRGSGNTLNLG